MTHDTTIEEWLRETPVPPGNRGVFIRDFMELIDDSLPGESQDAAMCWHVAPSDRCLCDDGYLGNWLNTGWKLPEPPRDFTVGPEYPTALEPASA